VVKVSTGSVCCCGEEEMAFEFPKPSFSYDYEIDAQIAALREYEETEPGRAVPSKAAGRLLLATWNIAGLGVQERSDKDYRLIAEVISWFDVVALQEVNDDLTGIRSIHGHLPNYRLLFSAASGNDERMTFLYDATMVTLLEEIGEVALPPSDFRYITLPGIEQRFDGFDRNPYLATFRAGSFTFSLVNVHLYFGNDTAYHRNRRSLETYAVARWADNRRNSDFAFTHDIIPMGDFNLPKKTRPGHPIYAALRKRGLQLPQHSTTIGGPAMASKYDQIAFFPGDTQDDFVQAGVFDFDGAVFRYLWETRNAQEFLAYVSYHISDHRLFWAEFKT
jgi:endonuclease/exonuclease/phosphatase family metal-dependent hydrolase